MVRLIAPSRAENLLLKAKLRDDAYAKWLNSDAGQEMQGRVARWFENNMRGCTSNQGARYTYGEMLDVQLGGRFDIVYVMLLGGRFDIVYVMLKETDIADPYDRLFAAHRLLEMIKQYDESH